MHEKIRERVLHYYISLAFRRDSSPALTGTNQFFSLTHFW